MGSSHSREKSDQKKAKKNQVSPRTTSSDESDSVSFETETSSSSSGRSTTISDFSDSTVVDQPHSKSTNTKEKVKKHHSCCLKCECYCDCGRDCTENCCCRCMKDTICCLLNFIWTLFKYFLIFCIYVLLTCVVICCPPLWILLFCSRGSRGILRLALWRNLCGLGDE